jgi:hypothetical protein
MKRFAIIAKIALVVALVGLSGCFEDETVGPGNPIPSSLVATWTFQSLTVAGQSANLEDWVFKGSGAASATMVFGEDNSYSYEERDGGGAVVWTETGFVVVTGDSLIITVTEENNVPVTANILPFTSWSVNGNSLSLGVDFQSASGMLTCTK